MPPNQTRPDIPADAPSVADGRYVLLARIDQGGMAGVYRAWDEKLKVQRAIKILFPEYHRNAKIRARFESEARTMARLEHNHLVRIYDVGTDHELSFLVMELVTGGTLQRWVDVHGPMPPALVLAVARQLLDGVRFVHEAGIVHRDIKPHNVLVAPGGPLGTCKLTDFGIAHEADGFITKTGTSLGTQGFMAPEQRTDAKSVDQRADVFGVGATLWSLLTGAAAHDLFVLGPPVLEPVPVAFHDLFRRTLAYDRAARYPDVERLESEIERLRREIGEVPAGTPPLPTEAPATLGDDDEEDGLAEIAELIRDRDRATPSPVPTETPRQAPVAPQSPQAPQALPYFMPQQSRKSASMSERRAKSTDSLPDYLQPLDERRSDDGEVIGAGLPTWKEEPAPASDEGDARWSEGEEEPAEEAAEAAPAPAATPGPVKNPWEVQRAPPRPPPTPDPPKAPTAPAATTKARADADAQGDDGGPAWVVYLLVPVAGLAALVLLVVLGAGAVAAWSVRTVGHDEAAAIESRDRLYEALAAESGAVQALRETGADVTALESAYAVWLETKGEPDRSEAAAGYLVALDEAAGKALDASPTSAQSAASHSIRRIRARQDAWDEAVAHWRASAGSFPGNLAVGLGLAHAP